MEWALNLKDKVALITGSTRGIGKAIAEGFLKEGATVIIVGRSSAESVQKSVDELSQLGTVKGYHGDVADMTFLNDMYKDIFKNFKRLDVLVNNAGVLEDSLIGMIDAGLVERVFKANVYSTIYNTQLAARFMQRTKSGSIINLASIIGTNGNAGQLVYGASKAAVIGATYSAAKELAPFNIRVNAIAPGFIDTDMTRGLPPEKWDERVASIKMKRVGTAEDIVGTAKFLAADSSSYITGQVIGVNGGMLI